MKMTNLAALAAIATMFAFTDASAAPFDSGSTGAYGPINITSNTVLAMPADGVFHCTTINVGSGFTLRFTKNPLNTPVFLLATGAVTITGTIDLNGSANSGGAPGGGGPGGFDGGYGGFGIAANTTGGDGQGPGGGRNVSQWWGAAYVGTIGLNTNKYGNALCSPLIGGSGGAGGTGNPGNGGGGGGGAILIAANTSITVSGTIRANGGTGYGGGSAGSIRLVAPIVNGGGNLTVNGGGGQTGYGGSDGRVRIDCEDRYAFRALTMNGTATRGAQMFVFPPAPFARLDIIEAAGTAIPEGTGNSVQVDLPAGSTTNRTVRVQARNFTGIVPITVIVIPENRPATRYNSQIDMSGGNPSVVTVNVGVPDGTISRIQTWTR
jgi:hypothetical protein